MEEVIFGSFVQPGGEVSKDSFGANSVLLFNQGVELLGKSLDFAFRALVAQTTLFILPNPLISLEAICHGGSPEPFSIA